MLNSHPVVWTSGQLLLPQTFQQLERSIHHHTEMRRQASFHHGWGFTTLALDEHLLATGQLGLSRAAGVLVDGTTFSMPDQDDLPAPLVVPADLAGELVVLAARRDRPGQSIFDFGDGDPHARYGVQQCELRDASHATDDPEPVQLAAVRFCLLRQRDVTDDHVVLAVASVLERRADGQLVLDRDHLPTQTRIDATGQLSKAVGELNHLVGQRARALAQSMGQLGHGVSEVAGFLRLQLLNGSAPWLRQMAGAPSVHPWLLHQELVKLAGALSTFAPGVRLSPDFPVYRHDDLKTTFTPVLRHLREMLSTMVAPEAQRIDLVEDGPGRRLAVVPPVAPRSSALVLAVRAQLPAEQLQQQFPRLVTLAETDRLLELVKLNLPGIALRSLPVAPRQLPFHANSLYFELERQGEEWQRFESTRSLGLYIRGAIPGLELELWLLRQA